MSENSSPKLEGPRVVVVFSDQASLKTLRFLKPGFRHCYALIETVGGWILYDPLSHYTHISFYEALTLPELIEWHMAHGATVVCCRIRTDVPCVVTVRPFTCVEAVKRILGLQAPWALTPWRLFLKLTESPKQTNKNKINIPKKDYYLDIYNKHV